MPSEIEVFIRVVESGSFSAAARDIGVLPSTVSRQITRLEERLGIRLLHRSTRSVSVTQVGSIYYEGGRRIVEAINQLEAMVKDTGEELRGTIRVAAPVVQEETFLARLISDFLVENPQTRVTLVPSTDISSYVAQRVDVAICVGELDDHDWTARHVGDAVQYLVASPEYLAEFGWPRSVDDLEDHYCVVYSQETAWPTRGGAVIEPQPRIVVHDSNLLVQFVLSGAGVGLVQTANIWDDLVQGRLCRILPDDIEAVRPIWVLYPRDRLFPPTARAFVDHCIEYFDNQSTTRLRDSGGDEGEERNVWRREIT